MGNLIDLVGRRFCKWTVLERALPKSLPAYWICKCDCGTIKRVQGGSLRNGASTSCVPCARTTHGHAYSSTYRSWINMKQRCINIKHPQYKDYGGRGITFCDEWHAFAKFIADMGDKPDGLFLERKDNSIGYCKSNCVWATRKVQNRNTRSTKLSEAAAIDIRNSTDSIKSLMAKYSVTRHSIYLVRYNKTWR